MLFFTPQRTAYDLRWQMFGIDICVNPWFWAVSAIMGWSALNFGFSFLLLWIGCVFVSILVHEMGHVLVGRYFGSEGHIILYGFGGLAVGSSNLRNRWERIAVFAAGPLAGFLLLGVVLLVAAVAAPEMFEQVTSFFIARMRLFLGMRAELPFLFGPPTLAEEALDNLLWINLFWGFLNLLPIWPLDGGQISRDVFDGLMPRDGVRVALGLSTAVAGLLAVAVLVRFQGDEIYLTLFFALLALGSYQALQQVRQTYREDPVYWDGNRWRQ